MSYIKDKIDALSTKHGSRASFGRAVGLSRFYLQSLINGKRNAGVEVSLRIQAGSGGEFRISEYSPEMEELINAAGYVYRGVSSGNGS